MRASGSERGRPARPRSGWRGLLALDALLLTAALIASAQAAGAVRSILVDRLGATAVLAQAGLRAAVLVVLPLRGGDRPAEQGPRPGALRSGRCLRPETGRLDLACAAPAGAGRHPPAHLSGGGGISDGGHHPGRSSRHPAAAGWPWCCSGWRWGSGGRSPSCRANRPGRGAGGGGEAGGPGAEAERLRCGGAAGPWQTSMPCCPASGNRCPSDSRPPARRVGRTLAQLNLRGRSGPRCSPSGAAGRRWWSRGRGAAPCRNVLALAGTQEAELATQLLTGGRAAPPMTAADRRRCWLTDGSSSVAPDRSVEEGLEDALVSLSPTATAGWRGSRPRAIARRQRPEARRRTRGCASQREDRPPQRLSVCGYCRCRG